MSVANRLIYIADPMCSWCWGFAPEFDKVREAYQGEWDITLLMGGLRPGTTETMDQKMRQFLRKHWLEISEKTGQPFNLGLLDQEDFVYDTEPAARAVVIANRIFPSHGWAVFKAIQHAFYADNRDTNLPETYSGIIESMGLDVVEFQKYFDSEEAKVATRQEFALAREMGINGFPSVVAFTDEKGYLLSRGYTTFEELQNQI